MHCIAATKQMHSQFCLFIFIDFKSRDQCEFNKKRQIIIIIKWWLSWLVFAHFVVYFVFLCGVPVVCSRLVSIFCLYCVRYELGCMKKRSVVVGDYVGWLEPSEQIQCDYRMQSGAKLMYIFRNNEFASS